MRLDAPPYAQAPFKRTSGYGYGGKHSATGNLAKPPPPRAPWLYSKRKWLPPARSSARSGAHTRPGAEQCVQSFIPSTVIVGKSATGRKVRKQLAKGVGILKVAKSLGIGTDTMQRISNELR